MNGPYSFRPRWSGPPASPKQRALAQWRRWDWSAEEKSRAKTAKTAAEVLPRILSKLRIDSRRSESEVLKVWNHQIDPNVTAHAQPTGLHKGTLFVTVDSSVWLDEIVRYRRREILGQLQNSFGREMIVKISFRVG